MKTFILALVLILAAPLAFAQDKPHPLAAQPTGKVHPLAAPVQNEKKECVEYFTCQLENVDYLGFRNGEFWTKEAFCASCGAKSYKVTLAWLLDQGYEIMETNFENGLIRIVLKLKTR